VLELRCVELLMLAIQTVAMGKDTECLTDLVRDLAATAHPHPEFRLIQFAAACRANPGFDFGFLQRMSPL
jgi:hypothetical protein